MFPNEARGTAQDVGIAQEITFNKSIFIKSVGKVNVSLLEVCRGAGVGSCRPGSDDWDNNWRTRGGWFHGGGDNGSACGRARGRGGFVGEALGTLDDVHTSQEVALDELCGVTGVGVVDPPLGIVDTGVRDIGECI